MTRGHNIVADEWAGAADPHLHPTPHPTPLSTHAHAQASKNARFRAFCLKLTDGLTDRQPDGRMYRRVACPQLKKRKKQVPQDNNDVSTS